MASTAALSTQMSPQPTLTSGLKLAADYGMFPVPVRLLLAAVVILARIWSR